MSNLAQQFQNIAQNIGTSAIFLNHLKAFGIIDVGQLEQVYANKSTGLVRLFTENADTIDAEICTASGLGQSSAGQLGLVIYPRSPVEFATQKVDLTADNYSSRYAKFIPLQLVGNSEVCISAEPDCINIGSKKYSITFGTSAVSIYSDNAQVSVDVDSATLYAKLGETQILANASSAEVETEKLEIKTEKLKVDGDVVITGSLKVAEASLGQYNFTVDKSQI